MKRVMLVVVSTSAMLFPYVQSAGAADGKAIYAKSCAACHAKDLVGAPKLGDKSGWAPRVAKGEDALVASVISGMGVMQPRAGVPSLSDADIRAAVEYMMSEVH